MKVSEMLPLLIVSLVFGVPILLKLTLLIIDTLKKKGLMAMVGLLFLSSGAFALGEGGSWASDFEAEHSKTTLASLENSLPSTTETLQPTKTCHAHKGTMLQFSLFNTLFWTGAAIFTLLIISLLVLQIKYQVLSLKFWD